MAVLPGIAVSTVVSLLVIDWLIAAQVRFTRIRLLVSLLPGSACLGSLQRLRAPIPSRSRRGEPAAVFFSGSGDVRLEPIGGAPCHISDRDRVETMRVILLRDIGGIFFVLWIEQFAPCEVGSCLGRRGA